MGCSGSLIQWPDGALRLPGSPYRIEGTFVYRWYQKNLAGRIVEGGIRGQGEEPLF